MNDFNKQYIVLDKLFEKVIGTYDTLPEAEAAAMIYVEKHLCYETYDIAIYSLIS